MSARSPLRITHLTAGTGRWYCGTCIRDEALVSAWQQQGHDACLVPLYLPVVGDRATPAARSDVYLGGVGTWVHHALPITASLPYWLTAPLDSRPMLALAGRFAGATDPASLGALTVDMLRGLAGHQRPRIERLTRALARQPKPDVIVLSNSLLAGLRPALQAALDVPIVVTVQGEHHFVDDLGSHRDEAWRLIAEQLQAADAVVAVSQAAARDTARRSGVPLHRFQVVPNGIETDGFGPPEPLDHPTIGYIARLARHKGLHTVVDAWRLLRAQGVQVRLVLGGTLQPGDVPALRALERALTQEGLRDHVQIYPNLSPGAKRDLLRRLTLATVAPERDDTGALYALEAAASGVPFVGPDRGALGEWVRDTGGGSLVAPHDPQALADALAALLGDPPRRQRLAERGYEAVRAHHAAAHMARLELSVLTQVLDGRAA